ncbi:hypothetical protein AXG93_3348s1200 [Marchantia polymorpha subsp. ruderalis]|uniref:Uncharacterized protein n=1 Tax=Marchantia polymorpha subsp. ruderalis TaxID=1480154 RepID=A0A176VQ80_MARPO|nr:hypothetical protein AXG93_3348s1200 [Marchantia polymorpha subsp. ruderalis]
MKARRLILEADSSTESSAAASRGGFTPEAGAELNMMRKKEAPMQKDLQTSAVSPTPVVSSRATRKEKDKAIMTEEVPPGRDKVLPLVQYLDRKRGKYIGTTTNGSYVELVRNRIRATVAATSAATAKERQTQEIEVKYEVLRKRLAEEVEKRRYSEKTCQVLREDIENAKCATVDLRNRLEASRTAYKAESQRVDERMVASEKKE